jgi:hypothetical protein
MAPSGTCPWNRSPGDLDAAAHCEVGVINGKCGAASCLAQYPKSCAVSARLNAYLAATLRLKKDVDVRIRSDARDSSAGSRCTIGDINIVDCTGSCCKSQGTQRPLVSSMRDFRRLLPHSPRRGCHVVAQSLELSVRPSLARLRPRARARQLARAAEQAASGCSKRMAPADSAATPVVRLRLERLPEISDHRLQRQHEFAYRWTR